MSYHFDVRYDAISTLSLPGYTEEEKSLFLTLAQERLVKSYYNPEGNKYKEGFEGTEKRRKDLSKLVRPSVNADGTLKTQIVSNAVGGIDANSNFFTLPEDFWLAVTEWGFPLDGTTRYKIVPVTHDEYNLEKDNPFKKPSCDTAWRLDLTNDDGICYHEVVSETPITEYHVRYIKKLRDIVIDLEDESSQIDSELNSMFHREIVDIAVELALETIADKRFQSMKIENQGIE